MSFPTVPALLEGIAERPAPAIRFRSGDGWSSLTYRELHARVRELSRGFVALGIRPGERVAVIGATRWEWTLADLAILGAGAVTVPVYHTNSPQECGYILEHSAARAIVCEDELQFAKVEMIRERCPDLEHVVLMVPGTSGEAAALPTLDDLVTLGQGAPADAVDEAVSHVGTDDIATVVYTSGTTGPPKGCILTHRNLMTTADMYREVLMLAGDESPVVFMFLPLAHVLARIVQFTTFDVGGELAYWGGDSTRLLEDIAEVRPTHFPSVPRVYEKVHTAVLAGVEDEPTLQREIFARALAVGARQRRLERAGLRAGPVQRARHAVMQQLVFRKVHSLFGGNVRRALTGAAPLGREVLEFFDAVGITIYEGFGMTETTAAATLNVPGAYKPGSVGRPLRGVEVAIADDGEILVRGPNVSAGYLHDEAATAQLLSEDGWLHTGDLGELDTDGFVTIRGRKKDLIITSSGKNIAPSNIETELQETRWISHAVVYGDNKPYLVALLTLDPTGLQALADRAGVALDSPAVMARQAPVRELLAEDVARVNAHYAAIEQIKRFAVLDHDLDEEQGELTPTMKVKRAVVNEKYREEFEALYVS